MSSRDALAGTIYAKEGEEEEEEEESPPLISLSSWLLEIGRRRGGGRKGRFERIKSSPSRGGRERGKKEVSDIVISTIPPSSSSSSTLTYSYLHFSASATTLSAPVATIAV